MISVEKHDSIHAINPAQWNSLLQEEDVFHTHQFICAVEESKVENARFQYLLFYDDEELVASAVLCAFVIDLTLFISKNQLVKRAAKWFPGLFKTTLLVCGLPASFGQQNLKLKHAYHAEAVCELLAAEMKALAKARGIKFLAIKEFRQKDFLLFSSLQHHGFFAAHSLPYLKIKIRWRCFDDYLHSLRHHYRRQVRVTLEKIAQQQPVIMERQQYNSSQAAPAFVVLDVDEKEADEFYQGYLQVMNRATTKLETLNPDFFHHLFRQKASYKLLGLMVQGKVLSSALLLPAGDTLIWMLVARQKEKDVYSSYRNLLYGTLAYAIKNGYKSLHLGQTAHWTKQCLGAEAENEYFWFASRSLFWHWLLKAGRQVIFPETVLKKVSVFKAENMRLTVLRRHNTDDEIKVL